MCAEFGTGFHLIPAPKDDLILIVLQLVTQGYYSFYLQNLPIITLVH